ncbi:MAG: AbrB/MazE/SpoVT family DNA-binding domain-containing protein [Candidatus Omnitrophota bacterium]
MERSFEVRQVNGKHQITLPNGICRKLRIQGKDYVKICVEGKRLVITPVEVRERDFTPGEVKAMDSDIKRQMKTGDYKEYKNVAEAQNHLKRMKK